MQQDAILYKRNLLAVIITALLLSLISVALLQPLYIMSITNIVYAATWLPTILVVLIDVFEIAFYVLCYPLILYAFFRFSSKKGVTTALTFFGVTVFRYLLNLIITWIQNGAVASDDLTSVIVYLIFEAIQLLILCWIAVATFRSFFKRVADLGHAQARLGKPIPEVREYVFPYTSLLSLANPIQSVAMKTGILLSATKVFTRILYDLQAGAPRSLTDLLWMVTYYASDLLIGVVFYALSLLLISYIDTKEQKTISKLKNTDDNKTTEAE